MVMLNDLTHGSNFTTKIVKILNLTIQPRLDVIPIYIQIYDSKNQSQHLDSYNIRDHFNSKSLYSSFLQYLQLTIPESQYQLISKYQQIQIRLERSLTLPLFSN